MTPSYIQPHPDRAPGCRQATGPVANKTGVLRNVSCRWALCRLTNPIEATGIVSMAGQEFSIPKLAARAQTEGDAYLLREDLRRRATPRSAPSVRVSGAATT